MDQLLFKRFISWSYLQPIESERRRASSAIVRPDWKNNGHDPEHVVQQLRCVVCHSKRCVFYTTTQFSKKLINIFPFIYLPFIALINSKKTFF